MKKRCIVFGMIALAMAVSADVRNIRPPTTGEGKLGTTTYKWGEVHANDGYYSNLILGGLNITNKFLSPYDGAAGEVFYANGLGGGLWGAASSPTNGISAAFADVTYASIGQGARADSALLKDGSEAMIGDLDLDGYDIVDAGVILGDIVEVEQAAASSMHNQLLSLRILHSAKRGYRGTDDDWVGADSGVGFYCVDADDAADFSLNYLSTNNYIKLSSPSLDVDPLIAKITGYGECTVEDTPVAGLAVGDHYVLFEHSTDVTRTNAVDFSKFGSRIATVTPDAGGAYRSGAMITVNYMLTTPGFTTHAGIFSVYLTWDSDLTTPHSSSFRRCIVAPLNTSETYDDTYMSEITWLDNELLFFSEGSYQKSSDPNRVDPARVNFTAVVTSQYATVNPN